LLGFRCHGSLVISKPRTKNNLPTKHWKNFLQMTLF
jgi:hypothetical protein